MNRIFNEIRKMSDLENYMNGKDGTKFDWYVNMSYRPQLIRACSRTG